VPRPPAAPTHSGGGASTSSSNRALPPSMQQQQATSSDADAESGALPPFVCDGGFSLRGSVACKLYAHQTEGVRWLWSLHRCVCYRAGGAAGCMHCCSILDACMYASRSCRMLAPPMPQPLPPASSHTVWARGASWLMTWALGE
jgi:hypothetical protein